MGPRLVETGGVGVIVSDDPRYPIVLPEQADGGELIHYAWCETCGLPIETAGRRDEPAELRPTALAPRADWILGPCGHGTWSTKGSGPVFTVGLVTTVGEALGPLPSLSIAGYDPSRLYEPPVAV